jgi:hypothetical protein
MSLIDIKPASNGTSLSTEPQPPNIMTDLIRSAKSGNEWTGNETRAYNIIVKFEDAQTFFGLKPTRMPPDLENHPDIVWGKLTETIDTTHDHIAYNFLTQLELTLLPTEQAESGINDFAVALLQAVGYVLRPRAHRSGRELLLHICGERKHVNLDVCIFDRVTNQIILLVQENTRHNTGQDPDVALVAGAIAAFQTNNSQRKQDGLPLLTEQVCIISLFTLPLFIFLDYPRYSHDGDISELLQGPSHSSTGSMC